MNSLTVQRSPSSPRMLDWPIRKLTKLQCKVWRSRIQFAWVWPGPSKCSWCTCSSERAVAGRPLAPCTLASERVQGEGGCERSAAVLAQVAGAHLLRRRPPSDQGTSKRIHRLRDLPIQPYSHIVLHIISARLYIL